MSSNQPPTDPIQQALNEQQQPKPTGFPLEVAIPGTPNVFRGNTPQEVLDQLVNAQANASAALREQKNEAAALRSQVEQLKAQIPPPPVDAGEAAKKNYYEMWAQDPDRAAQLQMAKMLGVPPDKVAQVLRQAIEGSVVNSAADEFVMRCPDFPQSPQSAQAMKDALAARFGIGVDAATADNLEIVYHQLVREGRLQPTSIPFAATTNAPQPLPNLRGNSAPPNPVNDVLAQARGMKLTDLRAVIERLEAQGHK